MDVQLGSILAALVPSVVVGLVGFLLKASVGDIKAAIAELKGEIGKLNDKVAAFDRASAVHEQRIVTIERDFSDIKDKFHRLQSKVTDVLMRFGREPASPE